MTVSVTSLLPWSLGSISRHNAVSTSITCDKWLGFIYPMPNTLAMSGLNGPLSSRMSLNTTNTSLTTVPSYSDPVA